MRRVVRLAASLLVICGSLLAIGAAGAYLFQHFYQPTYTVAGVVTRDGKPLVWKTDAGRLEVKFVPLDRQRDTNVYRAMETDRDGAYTIRNIPAGSYRVSIQQQDPDARYDLFRFALSLDKSPILRDVLTDDDALNIDIDSAMLPRR